MSLIGYNNVLCVVQICYPPYQLNLTGMYTHIYWSFLCNIIGLSVNNKASDSVNILLIILIPLISFALIVTIFSILICVITRVCVAKRSTSMDLNQEPTYEEITGDHIKISMEGNAAYAHVTHDTETWPPSLSLLTYSCNRIK